jgi:nucleoside-diphosphate-sugar epimerase
VIHPKHGPPCHPTGRPILLLGAHGQVGRALAPRLTALGNVVALGRADAPGSHVLTIVILATADGPRVAALDR